MRIPADELDRRTKNATQTGNQSPYRRARVSGARGPARLSTGNRHSLPHNPRRTGQDRAEAGSRIPGFKASRSQMSSCCLQRVIRSSSSAGRTLSIESCSFRNYSDEPKRLLLFNFRSLRRSRAKLITRNPTCSAWLLKSLPLRCTAMEEIDSILEIGCGTGFLTELLGRRFPRALIYAVDIARPMIDLAIERIGEYGRIRWHVADARQFRPDRDFPLIISSSALHWMTPVSETVKRLGDMLETGGNLVSALMVKGTLEELHAARTLPVSSKTGPCMLAGRAKKSWTHLRRQGSTSISAARKSSGSATTQRTDFFEA